MNLSNKIKKVFLIKHALCLVLLALLCEMSFAQINVDANINAAAIAQTLMGNSVSVDSAKINCATGAFGKFNSTSVINMPFNQGILLTTGNAQNVNRPANNTTGLGLLDLNLNTPGNAFLQNLSNQITEDACEIEVFLKPLGNQLKVDYIFASEEYPEQVNKFYYDAFAFIVNGPNPLGGIYSDTNIAKVGSGQAVTVATINNGPNNFGPCVNCNLYKNNATNNLLGYDGLTTPLSASIPVTTCQPYKVTIVIADVKDGKYDSGVFLKKGAINSTGLVNLTSTRQQICKGQSTNLNATSVIAQNYSWNTGETGNSISVSPVVSTNYTCYFSYCGINGFETITISVDTSKTGPNYSFPNSKICKSDSLVIATQLNGGGSFYCTNSNLFITTTGIINSYLTPDGVYDVTFVSNNPSCPGSFTRSLEVVSGPELSIIGGQDYCTNENIKPIVLSALGNAPYKFSFTKDSISIDTLTSNAILNMYFGSGTYSNFNVIDKDGCSSKTSNIIVQKKIESPKNNFEIIPNDSCSASGLMVQNLSIIERAIIQNYKWVLNDQLISEISDLEINEIQAGTHQLKLIAMADNGCSDTLAKYITIKPSPVAKFEFNSPCFGDTVFLTNRSELNTISGSYLWNLIGNNFNLNSINNNPKYLAFDSIINVSLKVKNSAGCTDSVFKQIRTIPLPKTHFTFTNVCEGDTLSFINKSNTTSGGTLYYSWDINNDGDIDKVSKDLNYFNSNAQRIWIKLNTTDEFGCKSNLTQMAEIYPKPKVQFTLNDSAGCEPFNFKILNSSFIENNGIISKYKWTLSNNKCSVATNPEFEINKPGKYLVQLEVASNRNCVTKFNTDSIITVFPKTKPEFIIYPEELSTINNQATIDFKENAGSKYYVLLNSEKLTAIDAEINLNFKDSGWHKITGIEQNLYGCFDTTLKEVYVKSDFAVYIPNTFTPNFDGLNELFCVITNGVINNDYFFRIVNRFNEEVFVSTTLNECWNGRDKSGNVVMPGVYVYELRYRTENWVEKSKNGVINLVR